MTTEMLRTVLEMTAKSPDLSAANQGFGLIMLLGAVVAVAALIYARYVNTATDRALATADAFTRLDVAFRVQASADALRAATAARIAASADVARLRLMADAAVQERIGRLQLIMLLDLSAGFADCASARKAG